MTGEIFLSYRRSDTRATSGRIYDGLVGTFPQEKIFKDVDSLVPGTNFVREIERWVGSCSVFVAVIGEGWIDAHDEDGERRLENPSDFVRLEIAEALVRQVPLIPVLVDGAQMPRLSELPDNLVGITEQHALKLDNERFGGDIRKLIEAVQHHTQVGEVPATPSAPRNTEPPAGSRAHELYQRAVQGDASALNSLGNLYRKGSGVPQDYVKSREYYEQAAGKGNASALGNLGYLYRHGHGVPQDSTKERELYERAADQGNAGAQNNLGYLYQEGHDVPQNYAKAREFFERAAANGDSTGMWNLAILLDESNDDSADFDGAARWLLSAASAGDDSARKGCLEDSLDNWHSQTRKAVQQQLREIGHYDGDVDGQIGDKTKAAVKAYLEAERGADQT